MRKLIYFSAAAFMGLFFVLPQAAHADFSYTRTPSGSPVSNPVTLHIQGVMGVDICGPTASGYAILTYNENTADPV